MELKRHDAKTYRVVYRILEADVKKRRLLRKMQEVIDFDEGLLDYSMTFLVWDILGLKKQTFTKVKTDEFGELIKDGYANEYDWEETLIELYLGVDGVIDGGVAIDEYIEEILELKGEEE